MRCKIGEKIRELRQGQKLTQENLADRLGVSFQAVSRWENGVTYPDVELLPAIARLFSVSVDYLLGDKEEEKIKETKRRIRSISSMKVGEEDSVIELIKECRREKYSNDYFCNICYNLKYSPLYKNKEIIDELRKSKDIFFENCFDITLRTDGLLEYACLENEENIKAFLQRNTTETPMSMDYLLKERYLFRDEFDKFESTRQRYFYKYIANLIDGDISLWRNASQPMNTESSLFEYKTKLEFIHSLCGETYDPEYPITCNKAPDVFAEQRIYIGLRYACTLFATGEKENGYRMLEDTASLIKKVMEIKDGTLLESNSLALDGLCIMVKEEDFGPREGRVKGIYIVLDEGETDFYESIFLDSIIQCLESAMYARWGWLNDVRDEDRFVKIVEKLKEHR